MAAARRASGATGFASVRYATWTIDSALAEPVAHRTKRTPFVLQVLRRLSLRGVLPSSFAERAGGCERIWWLRRDVFRVPLALPLRVPLALPVVVTRRGQSIQHWQSQWHTERNGQLLFFKSFVVFCSAECYPGSFAERATAGQPFSIARQFKFPFSPPVGYERSRGQSRFG